LQQQEKRGGIQNSRRLHWKLIKGEIQEGGGGERKAKDQGAFNHRGGTKIPLGKTTNTRRTTGKKAWTNRERGILVYVNYHYQKGSLGVGFSRGEKKKVGCTMGPG